MSRNLKRLILGIVDACLIAMSFVISHIFLIDIVNDNIFVYVPMYLITIILYWFFGFVFKVFSRLNRYVDISTVLSVGYAMVATFLIHLVATDWIYDIHIRLRFRALSYLFAVLLICISRFVWSLLSQVISHERKSALHLKRTLIVGAGEAANVFFKSLEIDDATYEMIGIVDDNINKRGTYLHNIRVLGSIDDLAMVVRDRHIEHVIIAIPSLSASRIEEIVRTCNAIGVTVNRMPHAQDILINGFELNRLRDVSVGDLLGREVVHLDVAGLKTELQGKVILVTGAGGSIGSEICRQVSRFKPAKILLVGQGENSIYQIHRELEATYGHRTKMIPIIADVKDRKKIFRLLEKYKPDTVYHAAAHKHVPLMELNPMEAVKNNIYGTKNVAEASKSVGVSKFVMVSTDKAVNPTNVMGASKRIAEMIVTGISEKGLKSGEGGTKLSAVRFGNVLGSRGSVIPLFKEQIAKGGPITLTDRRMTRYFMTIPEASRLVVQSGMLSRGGEVFVLDMGEPVKIYDLAKKMITLSGFTEKEIQIIETGIRPGEKLFEELLLTGEEVKQNIFEKIFVGQVKTLPLEEVVGFVDSLEESDDLAKRLVAFANQNCALKEKAHDS
ncbi:MAG: polysaccharide biosynthesis protein [Defluviitaleaceae bacterium]|nr:polysaccharide biosynthesis protein [Defluviitaleaceae bacterium]